MPYSSVGLLSKCHAEKICDVGYLRPKSKQASILIDGATPTYAPGGHPHNSERAC